VGGPAAAPFIDRGRPKPHLGPELGVGGSGVGRQGEGEPGALDRGVGGGPLSGDVGGAGQLGGREGGLMRGSATWPGRDLGDRDRLGVGFVLSTLFPSLARKHSRICENDH